LTTRGADQLGATFLTISRSNTYTLAFWNSATTPNIMQIIGIILVVLSFLAHDIYAQSFGPNTGSQWTTSSGGFTAASSCLCQMEYVFSVPWSLSGDSFFIQPFLFNGDASTWYYYDNIKYTNVTGTPSNPLTFQLTFNADQVTGNVVETASTTSKCLLRHGEIVS
jgi:hypothetical protein